MRKLGLTVIALAGLVSGSAMAADMPVKAPYYKAPPPVFSWTGFYVGVEGGWGRTNTNSVRNVANSNYPVGFTSTTNTQGVLGGFEGGANYQFSWLVVGIEGDYQGSGISGTSTTVSPLIAGNNTIERRETDWVSTVTGRLGLAYDRWLVFGKGGGAWRGINSGAFNDAFNAAGTVLSVSQVGTQTQSGYVVGGGVEWAPVDAITLKVEYDWYNFGSISSPATTCSFGGCGGIGVVTPAGDATNTPTMWEIKAAINFRLNWLLAGPVVAKY